MLLDGRALADPVLERLARGGAQRGEHHRGDREARAGPSRPRHGTGATPRSAAPANAARGTITTVACTSRGWTGSPKTVSSTGAGPSTTWVEAPGVAEYFLELPWRECAPQPTTMRAPCRGTLVMLRTFGTSVGALGQPHVVASRAPRAAPRRPPSARSRRRCSGVRRRRTGSTCWWPPRRRGTARDGTRRRRGGCPRGRARCRIDGPTLAPAGQVDAADRWPAPSGAGRPSGSPGAAASTP